MSMPLHIENGDITSILISGTGYDPQVMEAKLYENDNVSLNQRRNNDPQNVRLLVLKMLFNIMNCV